MPCVPIAASVTATGRAMIQKTKALAESLVPGSRVVYGDTVSSLRLRGDQPPGVTNPLDFWMCRTP